MKRIIAGAVGTLAALFFLARIRYAAGSFLKTAEAVGDRTYTTAEELTALFLIFCIVLLLTGFMLSLMQAAKALTGAPRKAALPAETGLLFLWYVYACLYGYPLLDNHFTTAWFMTGKYTAQLVESILNLFAGVAGMSFSWNDSIAWHAVCAALLVCPFVLMSVFLGIRNFVPVFLSAAGFAFAWAAGHYFLLGGKEQLILGAAASVLAAAAADRFSDESALGSLPKQKRREPLFRLKVGSRSRKALAAGCIALWIFTVWAGRIRSFTAVMRLIFSSDVYKYQSNVFELADVRIAQALLVSYVLSLLVKQVLSMFALEDDSKAAPWISAGYMLLLQIWVLPEISKFMMKAADRAQGAVSVSEETLDTYRDVAGQFLGGLAETHFIAAFVLIILVSAALLWLVILCIRLPFLRLGVWFLVWFSACTYIYCLFGLYCRSPAETVPLLLCCYLLNRMLNHLLSAGTLLRTEIRKK